MPVVTVRIYPSVSAGSVRVSKKMMNQTAYTELGIANQPESDWTAGFWDTMLFAAQPSVGYQFEKFCSLNDKVCGDSNKSMLEAEITKQNDYLLAYFKPLPPPQLPSNPNIFDWLRNTLFWWSSVPSGETVIDFVEGTIKYSNGSTYNLTGSGNLQGLTIKTSTETTLSLHGNFDSTVYLPSNKYVKMKVDIERATIKSTSAFDLWLIGSTEIPVEVT